MESFNCFRYNIMLMDNFSEIQEGDKINLGRVKYEILKKDKENIKVKVYSNQDDLDENPFIISFSSRHKFKMWFKNRGYKFRKKEEKTNFFRKSLKILKRKICST